MATFSARFEERGDEAMTAAAEVFALPEQRVRSALHYYAAHPDEIDAEVDQAEAVSAPGWGPADPGLVIPAGS